MQHQVRLDTRRADDVGLDQLECGIGAPAFDVAGMAGDEVVEADHLVAARQQLLTDVAADEAGPPRDEYLHLETPAPFRVLLRAFVPVRGRPTPL